MTDFGEEFQSQSVMLSLTVADLVELIEVGAIAETCSGYEPPIVGELRAVFSEFAASVNAAAEEV